MDGNLLLDTHVWIWLMEGRHEQLSRKARETIASTSESGVVLLSVMSVWELSLLESLGRVSLKSPVHEWIAELLRAPGAQLLPLDPDIAIDSTRLPGAPHGDPADCILMASARITGARRVTCDSHILEYARDGYVSVLDARP